MFVTGVAGVVAEKVYLSCIRGHFIGDYWVINECIGRCGGEL